MEQFVPTTATITVKPTFGAEFQTRINYIHSSLEFVRFERPIDGEYIMPTKQLNELIERGNIEISNVN